MAHLLVGSEGTLGYFRKIKLKLSPLPTHKTLGVVHFPTFYQAMDLTRHIVALEPAAVELVDRTMIDLSRDIAAFRGDDGDGDSRRSPTRSCSSSSPATSSDRKSSKLKQLSELMGDLGLPGSVVEIEEPRLQRDVWEVRKAGLNIMMSMKGDGKPVSFIEDCAVPLEHLADYTDRLTSVFEKHGTRGTWYAHASVGCLHVRPVLDMRSEDGAIKMRAIAEEACALVREYKGLLLGRARRRTRALGVDRADLRAAPRRGIRRDQARVRPQGPHESRQDRRAPQDGRPAALSLQARLPHSPR